MADEFAELLGMDPASIDGGNLTFVRRDLHATLSIWKDRYDWSTFGWTVHSDYTDLRDRMESFGGVSIRIDHPAPSGDASPANIPQGACYLWPAGGTPLAPEATFGVTQYGLPSLHFVRDPHDRGLLLLADAHVHRGRVGPSRQLTTNRHGLRRPSCWPAGPGIRILSGRLSSSCGTGARKR